ncbi:helix-turn-helix domain-containing protein [Paenisporosarcina sp. OV554]|uniref:response regulator transcription factor n=1 Tax=Paenisporosarcina sp. OV554 TaxID=2135694 RepID=UPI000D3A85F7|nr:helix-turn-helix domain-containing protein [Paenisporosarcina sp. OV554]PUB09569.1 AraC family two component transcriptional regulator [Paenisporosarcina sp. OV554]
MNILLVDDEVLELDQLEYLMKAQFPNWTFYKAQDASIALQLAGKVKISLAFLDIQMPGKNGLELAKELKKNYELDIIMVTAFQSFEYAKASLRIGVNDYLTKPIVESELLGLLEKYQKWSSKNDSMQEVLSIIREEYHEKLSLSFVANRIHLNANYLSRKFYEEIGIGFADYLNAYRLEMAKKLLVNQRDMSMAVIAEKAGFNSQHYFSAMFKKQFGVTPSEFRINPKRTENQ